MNNIYFCQFGNFVGNNVYLPYSVGVIVSYLKTNKLINSKYNMEFRFIKKQVDEIVNSLNNPSYLFVSVYMWNFNYSLQVAKAVKKKYPYCSIVLGGHHVPYYSFNFFKHYPFIDILVHGEGEQVCEDILMGKCKYEIKNITFNKLNHAINTEKKFNNCNLNLIPSPYLSGIFDDLMKQEYNFTASLETNRGCPFGCAYCDWGSNMTSEKKLRRFDGDRVLKEIEWMGQNKIEFVFGTDSNFGIFERDMDFVDTLIETNNKYGYPKKFRVCYTKNSDDVVYEINRKLNKVGLSKGATLSFQSLNEKALKAVGRVNIDMSKFKLLMDKYNKANIPTYSEMILGLPEETYDSFVDGLCELIENGQHHSIVTYYCQVYPNSKINTDQYRKEYGLITKKIPMYPTHVYIENENDIDEEEIIIATNTMNQKEWIDTALFSWAIQTFHCLGISCIISKYLRKNYNIGYREFYTNLIKYAYTNPNSVIGKEYNLIKNKLIDVQYGKGFKYIHKAFGDLNWTFEEGSFLSLILKDYVLYDEILEAITKFTDVDNDTLKALVNVNRFLIKKPMQVQFLYNNNKISEILEFAGIDNKHEMYLIKSTEFESLQDYAIKTIWYGRKGGEFLNRNKNIIGRRKEPCLI